MIRKIAIAAAVAGAALTISASAYAMDFPATPMNPGPPGPAIGDGVIPGMRESMMIVSGVTQPILQPLLAPGGGMAAAPAPMMMHHRHHHHMYMHKSMMMKKKMMMHKQMMMQR